MTFSEAPIDGSPFITEVVDPKKVVIDDIRDCLVNVEAAIKSELRVESNSSG